MNDEDEYTLLKIIQSEDQIGAVIRAHLVVEAQLVEILERKTHRDLREKRFNYDQKVWLACALKLVPGDLEVALKKLGKLRNQIAHRIGASITDTQQNDFLEAIPGAYTKELADVISDFPVTEQDANSNVRHLKDLEGRRAVSMAFAVGVFTLCYALWGILHEIERSEEEALWNDLEELEESDESDPDKPL